MKFWVSALIFKSPTFTLMTFPSESLWKIVNSDCSPKINCLSSVINKDEPRLTVPVSVDTPETLILPAE